MSSRKGAQSRPVGHAYAASQWRSGHCEKGVTISCGITEGRPPMIILTAAALFVERLPARILGSKPSLLGDDGWWGLFVPGGSHTFPI